MKIKYKKLSNLAIEPTRGSEYSAGYDLYAALEESVSIQPHTTVKIPTDLAFELPEGTFGGIFARSGLATKLGLRPSNCVGIVDADYRGNAIVAVHNDSDEVRVIEPATRIAQLVVLPFIQFDFEETNELTETVRGEGGFGSTGSK